MLTPTQTPAPPELSDSQLAIASSESDKSLRLGPITVETPVILAPMAGITNAAYRQLCREQAELGAEQSNARSEAGGSKARFARSEAEQSSIGLYVCEMITSRGLVERDPKTMSMLRFDPGERVRSVQLYGTDPSVVGLATKIVCAEYGVGHVDLNFGCPVPKVTRKGGGAALPWKRDRLAMILTAAVRAAEPYGVPVTMKTRMGIDEEHQTYLEAGRIAEESGCAAVALHGRTAQQAYAGHADWEAIAALKASVDIPVLGNGDIWEACDAWRMMDQTGVDGVVIGRGCLGRPWLFRDLAEMFAGLRPEMFAGLRPDADGFAGRVSQALPTLIKVAATIRRHAELLVGLYGEQHGCADLRKHLAWYLKGFPVGGDLRRRLATVCSLPELDSLLAELPQAPFPVAELGRPRGRQGSPRARVALPEGWLDDRSGRDLDLEGAELGISGG